MLRALHPKDIGGAKVTQTFRLGARQVFSGMSTENGQISLDEVLKMPHANRNALIERNYLFVWPKRESLDPEIKRHVSAKGFGRYEVIEGRVLNTEPLDREAAYKLAGLPMPPRKNGADDDDGRPPPN